MIFQATFKNIGLFTTLLLTLLFFGEKKVFAADSAPETVNLREILQNTVRDNTPLETARERAAWDAVFKTLSGTPLETLREESLGKVEFRELRTQPNAYRGRVVTIRGKLLRAQYVQLGIARMLEIPSSPIDGYYECWILLPDESLFPVCACVISLEEGIESGEKLDQEVVLNGYFYKRRTYPGEDEQQYVTPVILGKTLELPRTAAGEPVAGPAEFPRSLTTTILIVGLVLIWIVIRTAIRKHDRRR